MQRTGMIFIALSTLVFFGCASQKPVPQPTAQKPVQTESKQQETRTTTTQQPAEEEDSVIVAQFDTVKITKQTFNKTKSDIQLVVDDLNRITNDRDYHRWLSYLSDEYIDEYSDSKNLEKVSASLPTKGIKLKTLQDYFKYVFVPSRQNMRVDDIQFVSPTRVYVIMELSPKNPAAIYILEKTSQGWKLVLKNQ